MANIYEKLQDMRVELQQKNIKKSGRNKFAGYEYYELSDILPPINDLQAQHKTCSFVNFDTEKATLTLINTEKPDEKIEFTCPMTSISLKGAHDVQNMGALQTYNRRYLYMNCFEIVENDYFDCIQGKSQTPKKDNIRNLRGRLNSLIIEYSRSSNISISDITKELANTAQTPFKECTEEQLRGLLSYLKDKINKEQ